MADEVNRRDFLGSLGVTVGAALSASAGALPTRRRPNSSSTRRATDG